MHAFKAMLMFVLWLFAATTFADEFVDCDDDQFGEPLLQDAIDTVDVGESVRFTGTCENQGVIIINKRINLVGSDSDRANNVIEGALIVDGAQNVLLQRFVLNDNTSRVASLEIRDWAMATIGGLDINANKSFGGIEGIRQFSGRSIVLGTNVNVVSSAGPATAVILSSNAVFISISSDNSYRAQSIDTASALVAVTGSVAFMDTGDSFSASGDETSYSLFGNTDAVLFQFNETDSETLNLDGEIFMDNATLRLRSILHTSGEVNLEHAVTRIGPQNSFALASPARVRGGSISFETDVPLDVDVNAFFNALVTIESETRVDGTFNLDFGAKLLVIEDSSLKRAVVHGSRIRDVIRVDDTSRIKRIKRVKDEDDDEDEED